MNAVKVLKQSASDGINPNTITYSTTIEACARTGHLDVAVEVFGEMLDAGVAVTRCCNNCSTGRWLLLRCQHSGPLAQAAPGNFAGTEAPCQSHCTLPSTSNNQLPTRISRRPQASSPTL